ncbi:MAG: ribonuclease HII [Ignavibacteriales bacterium]|nr:ribonuclease HII [Ignavibacteriales bacterium]
MPFLRIERKLWQQGVKLIAGVDEAGVGPLAGPVVAAAVVFPKHLQIAGVDDSKKLTQGKRDELLEVIKNKALSCGVGVVDHNEIDRINVLQASILAMKKALSNLNVTPGFIIADGRAFFHETIRYRNIIDGDARCFTIAAASIIAKVTRDRLMMEYHERFPLYGFDQHKGYATKQHLAAIRQYGLCEIHRKSFRRQLQLFEEV